MVRPKGAAAPTPEEFVAHVQRRMAAVQEIYQRVIYREQNQDQGASEFRLHPEIAATPENSYSQMMQRLAADSPQLREIASRMHLSQHARRNLDRFLSSAGTTSERYGAVLRSPAAVERALTVFEYSEFLTDILVRHPEAVALLNEIAQPNGSANHQLFSPFAQIEGTDNDPVFAYLGRGEVEPAEAMSILRQQYRRRVLLSGALDLFHRRDVFDSLKDNTAAADTAIRAATAMAGAPAGFAVMALGRLGTREFDLMSDADVLFVCDSGCARDPVLASCEHLMKALTAYTREGTVFPLDARLRPHGREGELIVTPAQLESYFRDEAKPWEALTYLKLRYVAGDRMLADKVKETVHAGIAALATRAEFDAELSEVRSRLERSESAQNLKTGAGGSYDIDYLAGMLQAKHQIWFVGNLSERLQILSERGLLPELHAEILAESARFLRTLEHVVRLVSGRPRKWLPVADHPRRCVQKLLWSILGTRDSFDPEMRLADLMRQTRGIFLYYLDV